MPYSPMIQNVMVLSQLCLYWLAGDSAVLTLSRNSPAANLACTTPMLPVMLSSSHTMVSHPIAM